jgi:hypothetical protein
MKHFWLLLFNAKIVSRKEFEKEDFGFLDKGT